ncbi:succinoglycan biosynthesis protein exop [Rhizobium binxianense]
MYDTSARDRGSSRTAVRRSPPRPDPQNEVWSAPEIPVPEAELLRVIGRVLDEQRAQAERSEPLVDRIETILGTRFQAANDAGFRREPEQFDEAPAAREELRPAGIPPVIDDVPEGRNDPPPVSGRAGGIRILAAATMAAICGMALPFLMPAAPSRYSAETMLAVRADAAARAAATETAAKRLLSAPVIASTVAALKLDRDPEFSGDGANALGVALDLLSGSGAAADPASRAEAALKAAMEVTPDPHAGTIAIRVTSRNSGSATSIATRLAETAVGGDTASKPAEADATLRKAYDEAEAELAAFTGKSGEGNVKVATDLQGQIGQLDAGLKDADQAILSAKEKADRLKSAKFADVLNGSLPSDMISPALQDWRDKYATAKAQLAQLSAEFGPRHPRLQQQQAEVDGLKDNMTEELGRLAQDAAAEVKSAVETRKTLSDRRNGLIAQSRDTGVDLARLTELREKAASARSRLEELATGNPAGATLVVQKPARTVPVPSGNGPLPRALIGGGLGFLLGLLVAFPFLRNRRPRPARQEPAPPAPPPAPEPDFEMAELRSKIADLRNRLQAHALEGEHLSR